eukprot:5861505-Pyramimonas_sp.AAC.1
MPSRMPHLLATLVSVPHVTTPAPSETKLRRWAVLSADRWWDQGSSYTSEKGKRLQSFHITVKARRRQGGRWLTSRQWR